MADSPTTAPEHGALCGLGGLSLEEYHQTPTQASLQTGSEIGNSTGQLTPMGGLDYYPTTQNNPSAAAPGATTTPGAATTHGAATQSHYHTAVPTNSDLDIPMGSHLIPHASRHLAAIMGNQLAYVNIDLAFPTRSSRVLRNNYAQVPAVLRNNYVQVPGVPRNNYLQVPPRNLQGRASYPPIRPGPGAMILPNAAILQSQVINAGLTQSQKDTIEGALAAYRAAKLPVPVVYIPYLLHKHAKVSAEHAFPPGPATLLNLPLEIRFQIFKHLMDQERTVCYSYTDPRHNRVGIIEPLIQTSRQLHTEIHQWSQGRSQLNDSPMFGLYNPFKTEVCFRYRIDNGTYINFIIRTPLTKERCERIAILWRSFQEAGSDNYALVNRRVVANVIQDAHDNSVFYGIPTGEFELEDRIRAFRLAPVYARMGAPLQLPQ